MSSPTNDFPPRLGRYEIVERLSAGGMGEVFVARMAGPGGFVKPVALKRIHPHLASDPEFIDMLHDEARLAASVQHPNIVRTIDLGEEAGNHFVVLDFVCGDQVGKIHRETVRRGEMLPAWLVAWIGAETAAALHAVHEARGLDGQSLEIIHRDVSPGNVMLADDGHAMLFDFGVAKAKQRIHQTTAGELKGKLPYMAPETFEGVAADRTVDIFGLGVVLYELCTNVSPFRRQNDLDIISALRAGDVPSPEQVRPDLDPRLAAIIVRAMARQRAARFTTAAEIEGALRSWAVGAGLPHEAATVGRWLAHHFPERLAARRALLGRVASGPQATPSSPGVPVPTAVTGSSAPGGAYHEPTMVLTPTGPSSIRSTTANASVAGAAVGAGEAAQRGSRLLGVAVVVAIVAITGVTALAIGRSEAPVTAAPVDSAGPAPAAASPASEATGRAADPGPSAALSSTAVATAASASALASASASSSASAAAHAPEPGAVAPPVATVTRPASVPKTKGGLVREYE